MYINTYVHVFTLQHRETKTVKYIIIIIISFFSLFRLCIQFRMHFFLVLYSFCFVSQRHFYASVYIYKIQIQFRTYISLHALKRSRQLALNLCKTMRFFFYIRYNREQKYIFRKKLRRYARMNTQSIYNYDIKNNIRLFKYIIMLLKLYSICHRGVKIIS